MAEELKSFHVVWTFDIDAANALDAARHAREIQLKPDSWATFFQVKPSIGSGKVVSDATLQDKYGYESIDLEEQAQREALARAEIEAAIEQNQDISERLQQLLCASWAHPEDDYVIPAFLLRHAPKTYALVIIVDQEGVAVITHREI